MSIDPDTTRIVRSWLDEGVTELPDRVLDAVLDQVPATPQRRATWWPARRLSTMNSMIKFGLAAAVVAVAAILGVNYLGGPSGVGTPDLVGPSSTPDPTPRPHPLTTGLPLDGLPTLATSVTIGAPNWYGEPGSGILVKNDTADAPAGAGLIVFFGELYVYGDPCNWESTRPETPATTVDEVMAALAAQTSRDASGPVDITLDGYVGKAITLHVPDDVVFAECDLGYFGSWGSDVADRTPTRYHQDPGQIDEVWVVDVDGTLVTVDWAYYAGTPQSVVDELRAIAESIRFAAP